MNISWYKFNLVTAVTPCMVTAWGLTIVINSAQETATCFSPFFDSLSKLWRKTVGQGINFQSIKGQTKRRLSSKDSNQYTKHWLMVLSLGYFQRIWTRIKEMNALSMPMDHQELKHYYGIIYMTAMYHRNRHLRLQARNGKWNWYREKRISFFQAELSVQGIFCTPPPYIIDDKLGKTGRSSHVDYGSLISYSILVNWRSLVEECLVNQGPGPT